MLNKSLLRQALIWMFFPFFAPAFAGSPPATSAELPANPQPAVDDAYLKAMQMDEEDELDDVDAVSEQPGVRHENQAEAAPADPAEALKEKIDDIVDWAPEQDLDCD